MSVCVCVCERERERERDKGVDSRRGSGWHLLPPMVEGGFLPPTKVFSKHGFSQVKSVPACWVAKQRQCPPEMPSHCLSQVCDSHRAHRGLSQTLLGGGQSRY